MNLEVPRLFLNVPEAGSLALTIAKLVEEMELSLHITIMLPENTHISRAISDLAEVGSSFLTDIIIVTYAMYCAHCRVAAGHSCQVCVHL
jgi:hypothetical protein